MGGSNLQGASQESHRLCFVPWHKKHQSLGFFFSDFGSLLHDIQENFAFPVLIFQINAVVAIHLQFVILGMFYCQF